MILRLVGQEQQRHRQAPIDDDDFPNPSCLYYCIPVSVHRKSNTANVPLLNDDNAKRLLGTVTLISQRGRRCYNSPPQCYNSNNTMMISNNCNMTRVVLQ